MEIVRCATFLARPLLYGLFITKGQRLGARDDDGVLRGEKDATLSHSYFPLLFPLSTLNSHLMLNALRCLMERFTHREAQHFRQSIAVYSCTSAARSQGPAITPRTSTTPASRIVRRPSCIVRRASCIAQRTAVYTTVDWKRKAIERRRRKEQG